VAFNQPGTCVIDANQAGNDKYQAAPQAQQQITVKLGQTISFNPEPQAVDPTGIQIDLAATATSGNPVNFTSGSTNICTVADATVTFSQEGNCIIYADQAGDDRYLPAPEVRVTIKVVPFTPVP
jgi:hypothetical protein